MPYDATDYITASLNGEDLKSQYSSYPSEDFAPLAQFTQTRNSNETYTSVVTVRTDSDGSVSQSLQIIAKR